MYHLHILPGCVHCPERGVSEEAEQTQNTIITLTTHTHIRDLARQADLLMNTVLRRTILQDDEIEAMAYGIAEERELFEHIAANPAMLFVAMPAASVGLGGHVQETQTERCGPMPANLQYLIKAIIAVFLLLVLMT